MVIKNISMLIGLSKAKYMSHKKTEKWSDKTLDIDPVLH